MYHIGNHGITLYASCREIITGLPDDGMAECMATYVVDTEQQPMKIKKMMVSDEAYCLPV